MANYLIVGAAGYTGARLAYRLLAQGHSVRGVVCDPDTPLVDDLAAHGMVVWHGDVTNPHSLVGVAEGIEYVYNLTSASILNTAVLQRTLVDGNQHLLAACSRSKSVRAYIYTSGVAVYGDHRATLVTEDTPPMPCCKAGELMLAAEQVVLEHTRQHDLPGIVLRVATIYGTERDFTDPVLHRTLTIFGDGNNFVPRIHIDDLVAVLLRVATYGQAGSIYNVGDDQPLRLRDLYAAMQAMLDLPQSPRWYPHAQALHHGLNPEMVALATASVRLCNARMKDELRLALTYPSALSWLEERAMQLVPLLHPLDFARSSRSVVGAAHALELEVRC